MNKKNLIDAFGDINEEMFGGAEKIDITDYEESESQPPVIVYKGGKKIRKAPIFAAGAAACAVIIAVSAPLIMKSGGEYPLNSTLSSDTESFESITEISETASELITTPEETAPLLTLPYDQDFEYELYVKDKEFLDAEELYNVDIKDIDIEKFNEGGYNIDVLYLSLFYGDLVCLEGNHLYYSQSINDPAYDTQVHLEHEDWTAVYKYDLITEETTVVFSERADKEYGLLLKIAAVEGDWIYYYRDKCRNGYEENYIELWRCNSIDGRKEKMIDIGETYYLNVRAAVKSDGYLYFPFYDDIDCYIYCYDTKKEQLEVFKKGDSLSCGDNTYKDGILYGIDNDFYYHKNGEKEDEFLFNAEQLFDFDSYDQACYSIYTLGGEKLMYEYERADDNIRISEYGYLNENYIPHKLVTVKGGVYQIKDTKSGLAWLSLGDLDTLEFYDREQDCFSSLPFPNTLRSDRQVQCIALDSTDDEIRFIIFECDRPDRKNYYWAKLYTISKK